MNNSFSVLLLLLFFTGIMACTMDNSMLFSPADGEQNGSDTVGNRIRIRVGSSVFTATLQNNQTATAFKARLPLTILMQELNSNEKFAQLPADLPSRASNPGTIQTGDLMLYGSNTLVVFYKTFSTSYRYTSLGRISNPSGLAAALGTASVTVTFEPE